MGRAERRRLEKQKGKQVKTYNLTRSQLHNAVRQVTEEDLKRIKQEAMEDAINTAMTLLLVLPMEVLMDHYWKKTYAKKIPEFTELVLQYYERWQNGELDMDEMKKDLWEYGGVRLEEREAEIGRVLEFYENEIPKGLSYDPKDLELLRKISARIRKREEILRRFENE